MERPCRLFDKGLRSVSARKSARVQAAAARDKSGGRAVLGSLTSALKGISPTLRSCQVAAWPRHAPSRKGEPLVSPRGFRLRRSGRVRIIPAISGWCEVERVLTAVGSFPIALFQRLVSHLALYIQGILRQSGFPIEKSR